MRIRLSTRLIALALCLLVCPRPEAVAADKRPKNQRSHIEVANLNILHGLACGRQCLVTATSAACATASISWSSISPRPAARTS